MKSKKTFYKSQSDFLLVHRLVFFQKPNEILETSEELTADQLQNLQNADEILKVIDEHGRIRIKEMDEALNGAHHRIEKIRSSVDQSAQEKIKTLAEKKKEKEIYIGIGFYRSHGHLLKFIPKRHIKNSITIDEYDTNLSSLERQKMIIAQMKLNLEERKKLLERRLESVKILKESAGVFKKISFSLKEYGLNKEIKKSDSASDSIVQNAERKFEIEHANKEKIDQKIIQQSENLYQEYEGKFLNPLKDLEVQIQTLAEDKKTINGFLERYSIGNKSLAGISLDKSKIKNLLSNRNIVPAVQNDPAALEDLKFYLNEKFKLSKIEGELGETKKRITEKRDKWLDAETWRGKTKRGALLAMRAKIVAGQNQEAITLEERIQKGNEALQSAEAKYQFADRIAKTFNLSSIDQANALFEGLQQNPNIPDDFIQIFSNPAQLQSIKFLFFGEINGRVLINKSNRLLNFESTAQSPDQMSFSFANPNHKLINFGIEDLFTNISEFFKNPFYKIALDRMGQNPKEIISNFAQFRKIQLEEGKITDTEVPSMNDFLKFLIDKAPEKQFKDFIRSRFDGFNRIRDVESFIRNNSLETLTAFDYGILQKSEVREVVNFFMEAKDGVLFSRDKGVLPISSTFEIMKIISMPNFHKFAKDKFYAERNNPEFKNKLRSKLRTYFQENPERKQISAYDFLHLIDDLQGESFKESLKNKINSSDKISDALKSHAADIINFFADNDDDRKITEHEKFPDLLIGLAKLVESGVGFSTAYAVEVLQHLLGKEEIAKTISTRALHERFKAISALLLKMPEIQYGTGNYRTTIQTNLSDQPEKLLQVLLTDSNYSVLEKIENNLLDLKSGEFKENLFDAKAEADKSPKSLSKMLDDTAHSNPDKTFMEVLFEFLRRK
jgi:hypothetical protein